ncbi:protein ENHANCED DISEASE RESISTANCE 2-like [Telopea speciosissima]|uniref:protein ENHANCED DISEASE RESISTANCE 2-like n=1 Tax=Telopea speciosissima TaxID=54955 RepID=UPI001CC605B1|nr:protein ENHANCED DISEASE RESISTANCE 2-like [Telopea speciosissima]
MCRTTKGKPNSIGEDSTGINSKPGGECIGDWREEAINGGSLRHVDLDTGTNGWASPPSDLFNVRGKNYFTKRQKSFSSEDYLLKPAGVDWLRSPTKLDNVLSQSNNRVMNSLRRAQSIRSSSLKTFLFAVNLQVPGREAYSAVFYFAAEEPIPPGSLLYRFIHGDDSFRNQRFKIVNRIVKGPWIVKKTVGNYSACLLGKALTCNYYRGDNYFEIDVDVGSSAIATAILRLALRYVNSVTIDMGFLVEAQTEEELPETLIGAVRIAEMEMSSATFVESFPTAMMAQSSVPVTGMKRLGLSKVNNEKDEKY